MNGVSVLIEETQSSLATGKSTIYKLEKGHSLDIKYAGTLILNLSVSRTIELIL